MILAGGVFEGKRYLSESAVRAMTSTQTGDLMNRGRGENGYGLGWTTARKSRGENGPVIPGPCGHGGANATEMHIDPAQKMVAVFMVQHAGFPGGDKEKQRIHAAFAKGVEAVAKAAGAAREEK